MMHQATLHRACFFRYVQEAEQHVCREGKALLVRARRFGMRSQRLEWLLIKEKFEVWTDVMRYVGMAQVGPAVAPPFPVC